MSKLPNIIQRRELEPLLHKADIIARHYEKAANCAVCVMRPELSSCQFDLVCKHCQIKDDEKKTCAFIHEEAIKKAIGLNGSYIYACKKGLVFWTSPFYSGERYAGSLVSGGVKKEYNSDKVKALANMMFICADQISGMSYFQKNIKPYMENIEPGEDYKSENSNVNTGLLDMERTLIANLKRGDTLEARKTLFKLLDARYKEVKEDLNAFRLRALELSVLLSRAAANPVVLNDETFMEANSRFQRKINQSTSLQEIENILVQITEKLSEKIFSFHGVRHSTALRKAERFIWNNYTKKITLGEIARASGLSAPYFSMIFKEEMGENLSDYLNRLRVEKAASLLTATNWHISKIAKTCGFEDQSWFSKIFKINTGLTPGKYREQGN